jgi:hypothetical protein
VTAKEVEAAGKPALVTDTLNTPASHWPDNVICIAEQREEGRHGNFKLMHVAARGS